VTIESGSTLVHIAADAFASCGLLRSFVIPASLRSFTGFAFRETQLHEIAVEGDTFCTIPGGFVIEPESCRAICWFGRRTNIEQPGNIVVARTIRIVGECCFSSRDVIVSVAFEVVSQ
jgi:hypothetical protein